MSADTPSTPSVLLPPTLWRLFGAWLLIGCQSFGGGAATLALINRSLVEKLGWVSEEEFARDWAICQVTPGINLLAFTVRLGGRIGGICGSAAAGVVLSLLGLLLPSVAITIGITSAYTRIAASPAVQSALRAVIPATVGLGLLTAWTMARPLLKTSRQEGKASTVFTLAILAGAGIAFFVFQPPVLVVLILGGVLGMVFSVIRAQRREPEGEQTP